jgi:hypothetical protein
MTPCRSSGIQSSVSQRGGPRSSTGQVVWDLWWTKWHWGRFSPSTSVSPANLHSTDCSTFIIIIIIIIIYHPGMVQKAKQLPTYQMDSVSPHLKKLKKILSCCR